jgi:DNA-binding NtrC family response regulator/pSer/pThr/pTyr-binding forkhead associated (FHA) protein
VSDCYQIDILEPLGATASLHRLGAGTVVLGRASDCDVVVDVAGLSRRHIELEVLPDGGAVVTDLESTNGTRLNGSDIRRAAVSGDFVLDLGAAVLRLRACSGAGSELAYRTTPSPENSADETTDPAPETRVLSLQRTLKQDLWQAVGQPSPSLESVAAGLLSAWRRSLKAHALRLERLNGEVIAASGRSDAELRRIASSEDCVLFVDDRTADQAGLADLVKSLIPWLPELSAETARPPAPLARFPGIWPGDPEFQRQLEALGRVATRQVGILLLGETGVGKDLLAQWIHACSPQASGPFVAINCAALPKDLLEAELFGVDAGAATGVSARPGVFEQADGGTLFLDEVGDMAADTHVRLLRAIEDGRIHRVGGREPLELRVRLISATNQDLEQAIEHGRFRRDLYHRIAAFETLIPPLRERREDIAELSIHFFNQALQEAEVTSPGLTRSALSTLEQWHWPGNIRELRQALVSAVALLRPGEALDRIHLPDRLASQRVEVDPSSRPTFESLAEAIARAERDAIRSAIADADGSPEAAWRRLGIGKTTFYKKLRDHGLSFEA